MSNENLVAALKNKNDEFYTLYEDVEKECSQYDFSGKVVWLPTDDEESSFWQYFSSNYDKLGLKGLFATHIQPDNSYMLVGGDVPQRVVPLDFNGDFFSENCDFLWKQIDIVITHPPFSLYREFVKTILAHEKQFLLIGNENSTASRDLFRFSRVNKSIMAIIMLSNLCARMESAKHLATLVGLLIYQRRNPIVLFLQTPHQKQTSNITKTMMLSILTA